MPPWAGRNGGSHLLEGVVGSAGRVASKGVVVGCGNMRSRRSITTPAVATPRSRTVNCTGQDPARGFILPSADDLWPSEAGRLRTDEEDQNEPGSRSDVGRISPAPGARGKR